MANLYTPAPSGYFTLLDADGNTIVGGFLKVYLAGLSTLATTYADAGGLVANTNPVQADGAGRIVMFLAPGSYDFEYQDANHAILYTVHDIQQVPSASGVIDLPGTFGGTILAGQGVYLSSGVGGGIAGQWYLWGANSPESSTAPQIGFAITDTIAGATGTVRQSGQITGLSGLVVGKTYYVSTVAGALTDVPPVNTRIVGVADSSTSLVMTGGGPRIATTTNELAVTATGVVVQTQLPIPSGSGSLIVTIAGNDDYYVLGIAAGASAQLLTLINKGTGIVLCANQDTRALASDRLITKITNGNGIRALAPGTGSIQLLYDASEQRWRCISHEQGAWLNVIAPTGSVPNSFAGIGGTWTVAAADLGTYKYMVVGNTLQLVLKIAASSITGAPTALVANLPGYQAKTETYGLFSEIVNGTAKVGLVYIPAGGLQLIMQSDQVGLPWTPSADGVAIYLSFSFEVQ